MLDDELAEEGGRRRWGDYAPQWVDKEDKKDGYPDTGGQHSAGGWEGPCGKIEIEEVDVRLTGGKDTKDDPRNPDAWEKEIGKIGKGGAYMFSSGSLLNGGNVGGGAFVVGKGGKDMGRRGGCYGGWSGKSATV